MAGRWVPQWKYPAAWRLSISLKDKARRPGNLALTSVNVDGDCDATFASVLSTHQATSCNQAVQVAIFHSGR